MFSKALGAPEAEVVKRLRAFRATKGPRLSKMRRQNNNLLKNYTKSKKIEKRKRKKKHIFNNKHKQQSFKHSNIIQVVK